MTWKISNHEIVTGFHQCSLILLFDPRHHNVTQPAVIPNYYNINAENNPQLQSTIHLLDPIGYLCFICAIRVPTSTIIYQQDGISTPLESQVPRLWELLSAHWPARRYHFVRCAREAFLALALPRRAAEHADLKVIDKICTKAIICILVLIPFA